MDRFRELLTSRLPVLQAPMAGVQGSALAIAVSKAGGVGSLPCAMLSPEQMHSELSAIRAATDAPYCVNFFCHKQPKPDAAREEAWRELLSPYYAEFGIPKPSGPPAAPSRKPFDADAVAILEEFRPPVVSFHFGLPQAGLLNRVKAWGASVLGCATTVDEARWLEQRGVDGVIAQGLEAGGHRGMFLSKDLNTQAGTFALVRRIVNAVELPVIAAGGIADAAGVRAARELGAAAALVGTAYLMCPEATTSAVHKAALLRASVEPTTLTNLFSGAPARGVLNRLMRDLGAMNDVVPEFPLASPALAPLRAAAERLGDDAFSPLWCGQNPTGCAEIPAGELTRMLAA
jgi:nitronate monooxygenase